MRRHTNTTADNIQFSDWHSRKFATCSRCCETMLWTNSLLRSSVSGCCPRSINSASTSALDDPYRCALSRASVASRMPTSPSYESTRFFFFCRRRRADEFRASCFQRLSSSSSAFPDTGGAAGPAW